LWQYNNCGELLERIDQMQGHRGKLLERIEKIQERISQVGEQMRLDNIDMQVRLQERIDRCGEAVSRTAVAVADLADRGRHAVVDDLFITTTADPEGFILPVIWDTDDPWPTNKTDRIAVHALRQLGQSAESVVTPQRAWMCWLMYHDIKQRGYTFDSYINVDSTAGWTLAEAVQRIETENIYVKLYADNLLHALSKVLIGYTPRYLNNPPDIASDPGSDTDDEDDPR
jgi:hypothetical protein